MKITVAELREIANLLLNHLEKTGHGEMEIAADFYWNIPATKRYDPYTEPGKPDLGQLSDDWRELEKIAQGTSDPLNYGLVWMASILRRIGETAAG